MENTFCRVLALACMVTVVAFGQEADVLPHPYFEVYEQSVTVAFRDAEVAAQARVVALPLFEGRQHAVTCRWDDNAYGRVETVARKTAEVGIHGTFFLNGPRTEYHGERFRKMVRECAAAGQSVGTHGWSHPALSSMNPNAAFEDTARMRVFAEQQADVPVCSYAWAFMDTGRHYLGDEGVRLTAEMLFRSGHHCHAQAHGLDVDGAALAPGIGLAYYEKSNGPLSPENYTMFLAELVRRRREPSSYVMPIHPGRYKDVDAEVGKAASIAGDPRYWYCTMDEYGAYRNQFLATRIKSAADGKCQFLTITRPALRDLNNPVPLTLAVTGCPRDAVTGVTAENAALERCDGDDQVRFNLHHDAGMRLPGRIGAVFNDDNDETLEGVAADPELPELHGLLHYADDRLEWTLANGAGCVLKNVRLTFRLPLAFDDGFQVVALPDLADGEQRSGTLALERTTTDYRYLCGRAFFVLQVDASSPGDEVAALRLHLATSATLADERDPGYPKGGFAILGPVPADHWRAEMGPALAADPGAGLQLPDGRRLAFRNAEPEPEGGPIPASGYDVEYVLTTGTWVDWGEANQQRIGHYVLRSSVGVRDDRGLVLLVPDHVQAAFVDGEPLPQVDVNRRGFKGYACALRRGSNALVLVAAPPTAGAYALKAGVFVRMTEPEGAGSRAPDVTYRCPR